MRGRLAALCAILFIYVFIFINQVELMRKPELLKQPLPYQKIQAKLQNHNLSVNEREASSNLWLYNWLSFPHIELKMHDEVLNSVYPGFSTEDIRQFYKEQVGANTSLNQVVVSDYLSEILNYDAGVGASISGCVQFLKKFDVDVLIIGSSATAQALPPALLQKTLGHNVRVLQCARPFWNLNNIHFFIQQMKTMNKKIPLVVVGVEASTYLKRTLNESQTSTERLNKQLVANRSDSSFIFDVLKNKKWNLENFVFDFLEPKQKYTSPNFFQLSEVEKYLMVDANITQTLFFDNSYSYDYQNCAEEYKNQFRNQIYNLSNDLKKVSDNVAYVQIPQLRNAFPDSYLKCSEILLKSVFRSVAESKSTQKWIVSSAQSVESFFHLYHYKNQDFIYFDGIHLNYSGAKLFTSSISNELLQSYQISKVKQ